MMLMSYQLMNDLFTRMTNEKINYLQLLILTYITTALSQN